jgi:hypothetical protein
MMRVKFFPITSEQVSEIARKYGPMKPEPEPVLADALGGEYEQRWERFQTAKKATVRTGSRGGDTGAGAVSVMGC